MRIVNPSFGSHANEAAQADAARGEIDWRRDPVILFANAKPNARELLEGVRDRLSAVRDVGNIDYTYKSDTAQPAPAGLIEEIAQKYRAALLAIAD